MTSGYPRYGRRKGGRIKPAVEGKMEDREVYRLDEMGQEYNDIVGKKSSTDKIIDMIMIKNFRS
jgi:hypothetical protein